MDVVQALRRAHQVRLVDCHEIGIGTQPAKRPHDAIAHAKARGAGADGLDDTGQFDTQHGGQLKREGVPDVAFTNFPVDAVHAGSPNADQNLALSRCGLRGRGDLGGGSTAIGADQDSALSGGHLGLLISKLR